MPDTVQVRVKQINHVTRGEYNMVEIEGYDETNRKAFKKAFFAEKKGGGATANAQNAERLQQDDYVEITTDDSSYHNVQSIKTIDGPSGGGAPAQSGGGAPAQSGGGGAKKSGNYRTVPMLNRETALEMAVKMCANASLPNKKIVDTLEKLAYRMEAFISMGDFAGDLKADVVVPEKPVAQPDNTTAPDNKGNDASVPTPEDDDIPF